MRIVTLAIVITILVLQGILFSEIREQAPVADAGETIRPTEESSVWDVTVYLVHGDCISPRQYTGSQMLGWWSWDAEQERWMRRLDVYDLEAERVLWFDPPMHWRDIETPAAWIEMFLSKGPDDLRYKITERSKTEWDAIQDEEIEELMSDLLVRGHEH